MIFCKKYLRYFGENILDILWIKKNHEKDKEKGFFSFYIYGRGDVFDTFCPNTPLANRESEGGTGEKEEKSRERRKINIWMSVEGE